MYAMFKEGLYSGIVYEIVATADTHVFIKSDNHGTKPVLKSDLILDQDVIIERLITALKIANDTVTSIANMTYISNQHAIFVKADLTLNKIESVMSTGQKL